MTLYVKNGTWHEKGNFFKMHLWSCWTTFTNITWIKNRIRVTLKGRSSKTITEKTIKWRQFDVIRQTQDVIWKRKFLQNVSLIMLNNFYHDKHCLKIKLQCLKRWFGRKITKKRQNDGCMKSYVKVGIWFEKEIFFKMFLWSYWTTFTMATLLKNQVKVMKQEI